MDSKNKIVKVTSDLLGNRWYQVSWYQILWENDTMIL